MTDFNVSQLALEGLESATSDLRVSQLALEALTTEIVDFNVSQLALEALMPTYSATLEPAPVVLDGPCCLAEITGYDSGIVGERTFYISTCGYTADASATPANQYYDEIMLDYPKFISSINGASGFGEIRASDYSGTWGNYLYSIDFALRDVVLYFGSLSDVKADFSSVSGLVVDRSGAQYGRDGQVIFPIQDKLSRLNEPFYPEPKTDLNNSYPLCFGVCRNVTPLLTDTANLYYYVHPPGIGGITSVDAVYDMGELLTETTDYTVDLTNGKITLLAQPAGKVTADITGALFPSIDFAGIGLGGMPIDRPATILYALCLYSGIFAESDFNTDALIQAAIDYPQTIGLYVPSTDAALTINDLIKDVFDSLGLFLRVNTAGKIEIGQYAAPSGVSSNYVASYDKDDVMLNSAKLTQTIPPLASLQLGYSRNWTPMQDSELATGLTEAQKETFRAEYLYESGTNSVTSRAAESITVKTLLTSQTDAQNEVSRRLLLRSAPLLEHEVILLENGKSLQAGHEAFISMPKFGLDTGDAIRITYVEWIGVNPVKIKFIR